jgi:soluble lytic murein transglycosylase-like protein
VTTLVNLTLLFLLSFGPPPPKAQNATEDIIFQKLHLLHPQLADNHVKLLSTYFANSIQTRQLPANTIIAIAYLESRFDQGARGAAGEWGIMQTMDSWHWDKLCRGLKLWHARDNIECGCRILNYYTSLFDGDMDFGILAYNQGPAVAQWYKNNGRDPNKFWYVKTVKKHLKRLDQFDGMTDASN